MVSWFIAAIAVLMVELLIGTVYLLVVSIAFAGAGIVFALTGNSSAALLTVSLLSAIGIWMVHRYVKKPASQLTEDDFDIGQSVRIIRHLHGNVYKVFYRGTSWQAKADNSKHASNTGSEAVITGKRGNLLFIKFV